MHDELDITFDPVVKGRRAHIKVRTTRIHEDMTRYMAYRGIPETDNPISVRFFKRGPKIVMHRFQEREFTFFRCPSNFNRRWVSQTIDRYASFGVKVEMVMR